MRLLGFISRRDEDGTWWLANQPDEEHTPTEWVQNKENASGEWPPERALEVMQAFEDRGHYFLRYTAGVVK